MTPTATFWSPAEAAWVQVLERTRLFGRDLARVQVLGTNRVITLALDGLQPDRPVDLAAFAAVAAGAPIWRALASDLLLSPLMGVHLELANAVQN